MKYKKLQESLQKTKERLDEIPYKLSEQRIQYAQARLDIEQAENDMLALSYGVTDDERMAERDMGRLSISLKSLRAKEAAHKREVDDLIKEQGKLQSLQRELQDRIRSEEEKRQQHVKNALYEALDDTVIDQSRDQLAELIYYVSVKRSIPVSQIDLASLIYTYLDTDRQLTKKVDELFSTRKQEALANLD